MDSKFGRGSIRDALQLEGFDRGFIYTKNIEVVYFKQMNLVLCKLCFSEAVYKEHSSYYCLSRCLTLWNQKSLKENFENFHQLPKSHWERLLQFLSLEAEASILTLSQ